MKKIRCRLAGLLALVMIMTLIPMNVMAEEGGNVEDEAVVENSANTEAVVQEEVTEDEASDVVEEDPVLEESQEIETEESMLNALGGPHIPDSGNIGQNVIWSYADGVLTLTGSGNVRGYAVPDGEQVPWYAFSDQIQSIAVGEGITELGSWLFSNLPALTSVSIPSTVKIFNPNLFRNCTSLSTFTVPAGVSEIPYYCFAGSGLVSIVLPGTVRIVRNFAFMDCNMLENIVFPDGTMGFTFFSSEAFYNPNNGTETGYSTAQDDWLMAGDMLLKYRGSASSVTIPSKVKNIGVWAFYGSNVSNITIPSSVKRISDEGFGGSSISKITVPNTVTSMGYGVFDSCYCLEKVELPSNLKEIPWRTFVHCESLNTVNIPNSVTDIGAHAFYKCYSLEDITVGDNVQTIGDKALGYYYNYESGYDDISNLTIHCYSGSEAETYAEENGVDYELIGKSEPYWKKKDGKWYYMSTTGTPYTGKRYIDGVLYYLDPAKGGAMATGWFSTKDDGETVWHYADSKGAIQSDKWVSSGGKWYYIDDNWNMVKDRMMLIGGKHYIFDKDGVMQTGWIYIEDIANWYYADSNGVIQTGWVKSGTKWYYMDPEVYYMCYGWITIDGKDYYLNPDGSMHTGWMKFWGNYMYFDASGAMATGWIKDNNKWYYIDPELNFMVTGSRWIDGKGYYFDASGAMQTGWIKTESGRWYYAESNGVVVEGWKKIGTKWYYFDKNTNAMVSGGTFRDQDTGLLYLFDNSGAWVAATGWQKLVVGGDTTWYYLNSDKTVYTGWLKLGKDEYYLDKNNGYMYSDGAYKIDGVWYSFDKSGKKKSEPLG